MKSVSKLKIALTAAVTLAIAGCFADRAMNVASDGSQGPVDQGPRFAREDGDEMQGQEVFRFETFGNEGFWTDAARVPQGVMQARVTPMQALELGLSVDVTAVRLGTATKLLAELARDPSGRSSSVLHDPNVTIELINSNAVIGLVARDSNGDGIVDVRNGDKVGLSCALCHAITSQDIYGVKNGGGIGFRKDGPTNHNLNVGKILATAANSRALFPMLQLALNANGGKSIGRAPVGLTENSTEAEVDAYFSNPNFYPIGMFDDSLDGNGNQMHITPFFRQDLAAPFGSDGGFARLDNFNNFVYTTLFDPTRITTPWGRAFTRKLGGEAAGNELVDSYIRVLAATGVKGYPFVKALDHPQPGSEDALTGARVDNYKLLNLNAYLVHLQAPRGARVDEAAFSRGQQLFRTQGCVTCHNIDQSRPVPGFVLPMARIFPGDNPVVMAQREPPLNPIMDTAGNTFDDKMAIVNATLRGDKRGIAMPLLLDLARKPVFLHDNSVPSLDNLFDASRGASAPHPFFINDPRARADMVQFLRGLDTRRMSGAQTAAAR